MNDIETKVIAIQGIPISPAKPTFGQVLQFNGAAWTPASLPFLPNNISGLQLWLRADVGVTLSGSDVIEWADQSGKGDSNRNMVGTSSHYPTYTLTNSIYNNQSTVNFTTAGAQYMISAGNWSPDISAPYTIFIVGHDDGTTTGQTYYGDTVASPSGPFFYFNIVSSVPCYDIQNVNGNTTISAPNSAIPTIIQTEWNDPNSKLRISALTPSGTFDLGGTTNLGTNGFTLSTDYFSFGSLNLNGSIAEIIVYDSILSQPNLISVMSYFSNRYNITVSY